MSKALVTHTQQAFVLSLNIIIEDSEGTHFSTIPLLPLTSIIFQLWSIQIFVSRQVMYFQLGFKVAVKTALDLCELFYVNVNEIVKLFIKEIK